MIVSKEDKTVKRDSTSACYAFLNNSGSRWTFRSDKPKYALYENGAFKRLYTVEYFEMFGNFATTTIRIKGKRYTGFARDFELHAENGIGYPILDLEKMRKPA